MKIEIDPINLGVPITQIPIGGCFTNHRREIFMRTDDRGIEPGASPQAVRLNDGRLLIFTRGAEVVPIEITGSRAKASQVVPVFQSPELDGPSS